ncbi:MAG: nitrate reductase, partial [Thiobacillus sp.]|nr:nitrate reductase [Thiobacillus sp.]
MTMIYAGMFYIATLLLVVGLAYKIFDYSRTPAPLKIPTTPAPTTQTGVVYRMAKEVVLFESLFKANKWIWVFGWLFHFGLLLVLLRHLRYFTEPVWFWVGIIQPFGKYASIMMVVGLLGLLARRYL